MYQNSFNHWLKRLSNETETLRIFEVKPSIQYWMVLDQYHRTIITVRKEAQAKRIAKSIEGASVMEAR